MSTLSDLLPSGSGGKNIDFVASGTLSNGQTVALKSDGTVEGIISTVITESMGTTTPYFNPAGQNAEVMQDKYSSCFDSLNNRLVIVFIDNISGSSTRYYSYYAVGTISGSSISFGTATVKQSYVEYDAPTCVFDSSSGTILSCSNISYNSGTSFYVQGETGVLNPATNTIAWTVRGSPRGPGNTYVDPSNTTMGLLYDPFHDRSVLFCKDINNSQYNVAYTYNGATWPHWSSTVTIVDTSTMSTNNNLALCFDSKNNQVIFAVFAGNQLKVKNGTVIPSSGVTSTITLGSGVTSPSFGVVSGLDILYDTARERVVIFAQDANSGNKIKYNNGTVSGTLTSATVSWGGAGEVNTVASIWGNVGRAVYDANSGEFALIYQVSNIPYYVIGRVDATNPNICTFNSPVAFNQASPPSSIEYVTMAVNTTENRIGCFYYDKSATYPKWTAGSSVLSIASSSSTNSSFIGITDAAIADTATGSVTIKGGIVTNASLPTLTPNSVYYVQGNGTISTTTTSPAVRIGKALSSTSINLEFNS